MLLLGHRTPENRRSPEIPSDLRNAKSQSLLSNTHTDTHTHTCARRKERTPAVTSRRFACALARHARAAMFPLLSRRPLPLPGPLRSGNTALFCTTIHFQAREVLGSKRIDFPPGVLRSPGDRTTTRPGPKSTRFGEVRHLLEFCEVLPAGIRAAQHRVTSRKPAARPRSKTTSENQGVGGGERQCSGQARHRLTLLDLHPLRT